MAHINQHIGFKEAVPEAVIWSGTSFVKPVHPLDERKHGLCEIISVFSVLGMFLLAGLIFLTSYLLGKYYPMMSSSGFSIASGILVLSAIILGFFRTFLVKRILVHNMRSRSELLFEPDQSCVYIGIEDPLTYDKRKLLPEDFGLLKITPDFVQLEMTRHRAQFRTSDVCISMLHVGQNLASVRLTSMLQDYPWSIAMSAMSLPHQILDMSQSASKAKRLFTLLTAASIQTADEAGAESIPEEILPVAQSSEEQQIAHNTPQDAAVSAGNADVMDIRYRSIVDAIRQKEKKRKSWLVNIAILAFSLYLFIQLGFFRMGLEGVLVIILVLFVHELGHLWGMKLFGYKNVQMFFIPLMGAAVSGVSQNVASWKKCLVMLLGPLPGILLSLVLMMLYLVTDNNLLSLIGIMFLALNLLNLLPFYPLDGGHFVNEVLFSRNRYLELVMNILAAAIFLVAGFALKDWILKILGFVNLFSLRYRFKMAAAAMQFREKFFEEETLSPESLSENEQAEIPERHLKKLIDWIYQNTPGQMKPQTAAQIATQIWDRIRIRPPKLGPTIALLVLFFMGYVVSFVSLAGYGYCFYRKNFKTETKVVQFYDEQGQRRYKQQFFMGDELSSETELTDDKTLYHGSYKYYLNGQVYEEGRWNMGRRAGQWNIYDPNEQLIESTFYKDGKPVLMKYLVNGVWEERNWDDLSEEERGYFEEDAEIQQGPQEVQTVKEEELEHNS